MEIFKKNFTDMWKGSYFVEAWW